MKQVLERFIKQAFGEFRPLSGTSFKQITEQVEQAIEQI